MSTNIVGPYGGVSMPLSLALTDGIPAPIMTPPVPKGGATSDVDALNSTSDSKYLYVAGQGYYRYITQGAVLPTGARLTGCYAYVSANYVVATAAGLTTNYPSPQTAVFTMNANEYMSSPDGRFQLIMQNDGNVVIRNTRNNKAVWVTGTSAAGSTLTLQSDGNLVVRNSGGTAVWTSGTTSLGAGATLNLGTDGNLVIRNAAGVAKWTSGSRVAVTAIRNALNIGIGDTAGPGNSYVDNLPLTNYALNSTASGRASASKTKNSQGQLFTASDFANGLSLVFGATGSDFGGPYNVNRASVNYSYDEPPTAVISYPASGSTVTDTSRPTVTWDYSDDFAPQAKYRVLIKQGATTVYDSGLVQSADTFHTVGALLPNGTYTASVRVYQAWSGPGGDFPSLTAATSTFTVNVVSPPAPALTASLVNDHAVLTLTPGFNLLSYEQSTQDRDAVAVSVSNGSITRGSSKVRTGPGSMLLTTTGATSVVSLRPVVTVVPGKAYAAGVFGQLASAGTGKTAQLTFQYWDVTGAALSTQAGTATTLTATDWQRATVTSTAPAGATWASLVVTYVGSSSDSVYFDDFGLWFSPDGSVPAFAAGGFFESTPNLLSYGQSSFEGTAPYWRTRGTGDTVAISSAVPAFHGNQTLAVTSGGGTAMAVGMAATSSFTTSLVQFPVDPTKTTYAGVFVRSGGTSRTAKLVVTLNDGTTYSQSVTDTPNWQPLKIQIPPTTGLTSVSLYVGWTPSSGNLTSGETHYVEMAYIHQGGQDLGPVEGFQDGDKVPTVLIEYTDDGQTWAPLQTDTFSQTDAARTYVDYSLRSNTLRQYRASYSQSVSDRYVQSLTSAVSWAKPSFTGVFLHSVADPAGTVHQFKMDGSGRTEKYGLHPVLTTLATRPFAFAEFGTDQEQSVSVNVMCFSETNDVQALATFATTPGELILRDGRGRGIRGVLTNIQITDAVWGASASFDFTRTGDL